MQERDRNFIKYAEKHIFKRKKKCFKDYEIGEKVLVYWEVKGNKFSSGWKEGYKIDKIL